MAEVEWVNIATGEIKTGDENLYKPSMGWLPVKWVVIKGKVYRSTLSSFADWLKANTSVSRVDYDKDSETGSIRSLTCLFDADIKFGDIGEALTKVERNDSFSILYVPKIEKIKIITNPIIILIIYNLTLFF